MHSFEILRSVEWGFHTETSEISHQTDVFNISDGRRSQDFIQL